MRMTLMVVGIWILSGCFLYGQDFVANYDESKVPAYTLPALMQFEDGRHAENLADWRDRRNEVIHLFEQEVYGVSPPNQGIVFRSEVISTAGVFNGLALLKEVRLTLIHEGSELDLHLLIHLPKVNGPVPIFLGLNFYGNHTTADSQGVWLNQNWMRNNEAFGITGNRATEASRGVRVSRWPAKEIVERGYGLVTVYCGDIDPDYEHGFTKGVHGLMDVQRDSASWGTLSAWAWGLSRVLDYLESEPMVDHDRVIAIGHSRLGKAALWAGAIDERFAMVISNNSGCGGAALSRRQFGETVGRINYQFPHWFNDNFKNYNQKEDMLPVDQHQLIALIAPRPVYVASAADDLWADPRGEFLSCLAATPVYELYGLRGLPVTEMPAMNEAVMGTIGYHIREGGHDIALYDWLQYLDFADKHFGGN